MNPQPKYMLYPSLLDKFEQYLRADEEAESFFNIDNETGEYKKSPDEVETELKQSLIDCINRIVRQKIPVREACLQAARGRLRPILMTTLTTILGLIPLAFFPGEGAEMIQPIALTFVGGITTGAFLTLLLSPVLYSILNTRREKKYDDPQSLNNQLIEYDSRRLKDLDSVL